MASLGLPAVSYESLSELVLCAFLQYLAMERALLRWKVPGSWFESIVGFMPSDRPLLRKALGVRALQHGLGTFALVLTYHTTLQTAVTQKAQRKASTLGTKSIDPRSS